MMERTGLDRCYRIFGEVYVRVKTRTASKITVYKKEFDKNVGFGNGNIHY